jgi:hypothetical protein
VKRRHLAEKEREEGRKEGRKEGREGGREGEDKRGGTDQRRNMVM